MWTATCTQDISQIGGGNVVTGSPVFSEGAKIIFRGEGNVLLCEEGVTLSGVIDFKGNDAVVYLARNKYAYSLNLTMWHETTCYMGEDNYFNGRLSAIVSERRSLIIGDNCLFSFGIWIRTADPHLIYDAKSMARINCSKVFPPST